KELSPWVMFMSADIIVKAVMIGLAFASLVTWTVFIAKSIELSVASAKLRSALKKVAEARSLAEAQMALGAKEGILPSFLAAALLATAIGLVAAIPAVIIYNHFSRVTKSYLELVSRASGASGRLLSRDLDRSHGSVHSRAAE